MTSLLFNISNVRKTQKSKNLKNNIQKQIKSRNIQERERSTKDKKFKRREPQNLKKNKTLLNVSGFQTSKNVLRKNICIY